MLSAPEQSPTTLNEFGISFLRLTNAGCLSRLPPKNIRFPILALVKWFANSVRENGAFSLILNMNPNHEHSLLQLLVSHLNDPSVFQLVACVGSEKLNTS